MPAPVSYAPQPSPYVKPSGSPGWLNDWVGALKTEVHQPALPKPTVEVAQVEPKPAYGITTSYKRSWGASSYTKPEKKDYTPYAPKKYERKPYTPPTIGYTRPKPPVVEEPKETKYKSIPPPVKPYSGSDSNTRRYLRTYTNPYNGTPQKPHSNRSCL